MADMGGTVVVQTERVLGAAQPVGHRAGLVSHDEVVRQDVALGGDCEEKPVLIKRKGHTMVRAFNWHLNLGRRGLGAGHHLRLLHEDCRGAVCGWGSIHEDCDEALGRLDVCRSPSGHAVGKADRRGLLHVARIVVMWQTNCLEAGPHEADLAFRRGV
eukprot:CAMPEP_0178464620 /NCGR_PEP_ID=MMETSP0689_2-20121128/50934_1 /TAXON_ID=160604 /ORGANISM="Amphidinium massartii, Strain CS-259" /LENGTH=157 /DNA_ID=CAMNT_0020091523 /DNA_START=583 /DNA_END=1053 /DNA_ORIENTATION=+